MCTCQVATDADIRERNSKLVPELLVTLKELQERERSTDERFKRPFALFSRSPHKAPRRLSSDTEMEGVARLGSGTNGDSGLHAGGDTAEGLGSRPGAGARRALLERGGGGSGLAPGWPGGLLSPPRGDNSNSSWAEMELDVIGHFDVFPLTTQV